MSKRYANMLGAPLPPAPNGIDLYNAGVLVPGGPFTALRATGGNPVFSNLGGGIGGVAAMGGGGGVGPGTVDTLAMFTAANAVGDSTAVQDLLHGTNTGGHRIRATDSFGIGADPALSGSFDLVFGIIAGAGLSSQDATVPMERGFDVEILQDVTGTTFGGNWTSFEDGFSGTGDGGHAFNFVRGFGCDAFVDGAGTSVAHMYGFVSAPGVGNGVTAGELAAFYATPFTGSAPATVAYGLYVNMSSVTATATYAIYVDPSGGGIAFFGGGMASAANVAMTAGVSMALNSRSGAYTLPDGDITDILDGSGGPVTVALPAANSLAGRWFNAKRIDSTFANAVTLVPNGTDTIDGVNAPLALTVQYQSYNLQSDGVSGWWIL